jgi:trans-2-enoyl-CoA reductase
MNLLSNETNGIKMEKGLEIVPRLREVVRMDMSRAVVYREYGRPGEVLQLEEHPLPELGPGDVRIRVLAAPIHPSDFGMILGKYGSLKELPAIAGREGVGTVEAVGSAVSDLTEGDRVVVPTAAGTWQTACVVPAKGLFKVPVDLPLEIAANLRVNPPTAWRLLRDAHLAEGDWVIQNAANSAVGLHVIEMARYLGLKTLNVVRREELIEPLTAHGADVVVLEESGYEKEVNELTGGVPIKLALNSVGGQSALRLVKALGKRGQHVTFGAMTFDAVRLPTADLIFKDIRMTGFWMDRWYRENSAARAEIMFEKLFNLMRRDIVKATISGRFGIEEYAEAVQAAADSRLGKVLFEMQSKGA